MNKIIEDIMQILRSTPMFSDIVEVYYWGDRSIKFKSRYRDIEDTFLLHVYESEFLSEMKMVQILLYNEDTDNYAETLTGYIKPNNYCLIDIITTLEIMIEDRYGR